MATVNTKRLLLVDGDETQVLSVTTERVVRTLDLFDRIQIPRDNVMTPILPIGCRRYISDRDRQAYVIEAAPSTWIVNHVRHPDMVFEIAVPHVILYLGTNGNIINHEMLFFAKEPIKSLSSPVFYSALPNQRSDGTCCAGHDFDYISGGREPLCDRLNKAMPYFKSSMFNDDLNPYTDNIPTEISTVHQNDAARAQFPVDNIYRTLAETSPSPSERLIAKWHMWTQWKIQTLGRPETLVSICRLPWRAAGEFGHVTSGRH